MGTSSKSGSEEPGVERTSRRMRTLEEKLAIIEQASRPGVSVALVARQHGVNANQVFGWIRLHRQGLLESQRHGKPPPLLPVKIATPTLTPTERSVRTAPSRRGRPPKRVDGLSGETMLELVLPEGLGVRLYGEAQRAVLERLLQRLSPR